jgi:hypothetical protein
VRRNLIFSDREAAFLRELLRHKVHFMIVGLSAAALQGASVVTQDVDLWFRDLQDPGIRRALKKLRGAYVPPLAMNPPMFVGKAVGLFDIVVNMSGLDSFDKEEKKAVEISLGKSSVKVLSLAQIIKSKRAAGRQKDKLVLPVLVDALKTLSTQ